MVIEVEHHFIDYQPMIIGEKIRGKKDYALDDEVLANLMLIEDVENLEFYRQEFVQKIIDLQFP